MTERRAIVGDVMTRHPYWIGPDATLADAQRRMSEHRIRHLPVMRAGKLVGILSNRDLSLVASLSGTFPRTVTVATAMTEEPYAVAMDAPLLQVVTSMAERKIGTAVVTEDGQLRGIFTTTDALRVLGSVLRKLESP